MAITLAFDIGYASIGWCALSADDSRKDPEFLGTGVVTFPTDDCLASRRRDLRRTRRHIRSTRLRIERMKRWLVHRGVLSRQDLDRPGHPAPFLLAAAALQGHRMLNAWELWTVLRWYAHNRGYDGNARWSREEATDDDTAKEAAAKALMAQHGTTNMATTVCACLKLDPGVLKLPKKEQIISSRLPYKTLNAAYPRATVQKEVLDLLLSHLGKIPGLDDKALDLLFTPEALSAEDRDLLKAADIKLPKRYHGGLLFGQLLPRFDNRIISRCPITWAKTYDEAIAEGKSDEQARQLADKFAKVPAAKCREFLEYRFARVLANIKADGKPIDKELRQQLWGLAEKQGRLTHADIKKAVKQHCGDVPTNLEAYFKLHPDSEEALVLDPVMDEVRKAAGSQARLAPFWKHLAAETKQAVIDEWRNSKAVSLVWISERAGENPALAEAFRKEFAAQKPKKGEIRFETLNEYLQAVRIGPKIPSGRAPYARAVLRQVAEEVRNGWDATKANKITDPENGENKPTDGILYAALDPSSRVRQLQAERPIEQLTNNHLVRHRLLILDRLLDDILAEFASEEKQVAQVIVEVARELKEFSGKDRVAIKQALGRRMAHHAKAVEMLVQNGIEPNANRIKKCRIALDLNWTCPFTQRLYGPSELDSLEFEHIIPRSQRLSDSMAGLVLTRQEVNKAKGNRTAMRFIIDSAKDGLIVPPSVYEKWVQSLKVSKKETHPDDYARQSARKRLLLLQDYEEKERTFTDGQLTQSSHLMKLAMGALKRKLPQAAMDPIPGPVTSEIRKSWKLTGTLAQACPEVLDSEGKVRPKDEIRGLTHLHHALDAATLALAAHYFPLRHRGENQTGKIWQALLKRQRTEEEKKFLKSLGIFVTYGRLRRAKDGNPYEEKDVRLDDLPKAVKEQLSRSLAECRVMQHLPSDRSGAKTKLTTWGVEEIENGRAKLRQQGFIDDSGKPNLNPDKSRKRSYKEANPNGKGADKNWLRLDKLLGPQPKNSQGKLEDIKGAMVIEENYGLALDPKPTVIPFHDVSTRLVSLRQSNGGKPVRVLRNGMLIRVDNWPEKEGLWRIMSCKASMKLDLARPQETKASWREVAIPSLVTRGLIILPRRYTGHPLTD